MAGLALTLYAVALTLAFGWRTFAQWRRTGDTGLRLELADRARCAGGPRRCSCWRSSSASPVPEATRVRVVTAAGDLGYVRRGVPRGELSPHWRRTGFATWLFQPAATGWYPRVSPHDPRPVPVLREPWPGVPVRGRGAAGRADACWLPVAAGLTPYGLRHGHKTLMEELGVPAKLQTTGWATRTAKIHSPGLPDDAADMVQGRSP